MGGGIFREVWLEGNKHPRVCAYYFRQWADYAMGFHTHESVEIMYVLSGECRIEVDAAPASLPSAFQLKKGEFILLDAGVPHRLIVNERGPCRMLNVEFDMAESATELPSLRQLAAEDEAVAELVNEPSSFLVLRDSDELYPLLKNLVLELGSGERRRDVRVRLLFAQLLVTIAHIRRLSLDRGDNPADRYVQEAIRYMHQNYDRDIRVQDVASAVNLHPGYLHRVFGAGTGMTITAYLTELRMEKARMLLRRTDIPIADICEYVGIGSRAYFHAVFKKHTGQTPVAYRRSQHIWGHGEAARQTEPDTEGDDS